MAILINKFHALSVLRQSSCGSADVGVYSDSLVQSTKIAVDKHMQFLGEGKGEYKLHVD